MRVKENLFLQKGKEIFEAGIDKIETEEATMKERIMLSVSEAAQKTGLGANTIRRLCREGGLPHLKVGVKILLNQEVLFAFLKGKSEEWKENQAGGIRPIN
jgi:excisionase family DNA binding protein